MAEGVYSKLRRVFTGATIPPFQREFIGRLFPSENIGDIDVSKWAKRILKSLGEVSMQEATGEWNPPQDKFDMTSVELAIYDYQKRITMNRAEVRLFDKNNIMPIGMDELGSVAARKMNYNLFRGKKAPVDKFPKTQYNYITEAAGDGTSYSQPKIISAASAAGDWNDDAGAAQKEIAQLAGNLRRYGFNPRTSVMFYPEVVEAYMRMPIVTGSSIYGDISILEYALNQGFLGAIPVPDELLYTAASATPTKDAWDAYAVDLSSVILGYTIPENTEVNYDNISRNTMLDFEASLCPFFTPRKYDDSDGLIYKGVSRITAIDCSD